MAKKGAPQQGSSDKEKWPSLFDWAESVAARLGRKLDDVAAVSVTAVPTICGFLGTWWQQSAQGSPLRLVLAVATILTLFFTFMTWGMRAYQSSARSKIVPIVFHAGALSGAGLVLLGVFCVFLYSDLSDVAHRDALAAKELTERAAEKKKEDDRRAQMEAARLAEEECQKARTDAIDKAKKVHWSTRKTAEECQEKYNAQFIKLQSVDEYCGASLAKFDGAKARLNAANAKVCSTASIKR